MPVRCQDCNSHFLLDGTTIAQGIGCPDCGGTKLERDQPSPTQSDGELRNMVDPATQLDQGGNPLQEGVWAGIDGGWQPAHKRDEYFAKVAASPGITWTPGLVGNGGWDHAGNLHAWNVRNLPPTGVTIAHKPFIIGADGTVLGAPAPHMVPEILERVPGTKAIGYSNNRPTQAKTSARIPPPSGIEPQHHQEGVVPGRSGLHNGNLYWLGFLDASVNGMPVREHMDELAFHYGINRNGPHFGQPVTISVHHPEHLAGAVEAAQSDELRSSKQTLVHAPTLASLGQGIMRGQIPPPPGIQTAPQPPAQPPVMSNHYSRSLSMEPYLPWFHQADVTRYPAGDRGNPVTLTNEEWASDKRQRYLDRQNGGHRLNWQPGTQGRGIMVGSQLHTWPVEKTMDNPQGGDMHGEYVQKLGVNPANFDPRTGFEIEPDGTMIGGNLPPEAPQIDPNLQMPGDDWGAMFGSTKTALGPLMAPLLAVGGRALLSAAVGGLMRKAIHGAGNFLDTAPQPEQYPGARPVSLVASEHVGVGHAAPVETFDSVPDLVEDHDPESTDQSEFNDQSDDSNLENPNNDNADGGLSQSQGEDATNQKLEFRHDGDGISQAELLLPLILEYFHSDKSALENPQLKALHDALDAEIPGYLDKSDENDESVHKLLEALRDPKGVEASTKEGYSGEAQMPANYNPQADFIQQALRMADYLESIGDFQQAEHYKQMAAQAGHHASVKEGVGVYNTTPLNPGQQQMGVGQQMAMPGTHQNPVQPGGMPVSGKCMNCGGVVNADGSCPQCGAAAGANQMGNMETGQQTPLGIMPSPYAHTSADHQGPITPQQKEVFAEYLIAQGRQDEVAAMMANPGIYADEWAQYLNRQTQPPEVDPAEQAPLPQVDPSQMGQMPVPGMSVPPPGQGQMMAKTALSDRRCPNCESATTNIINGDGDMRCHRCGHVWKMDLLEDTPAIKSHWTIKHALVDPIQPNQSPANPVAAPAADQTAPGDREQQADSTLTWQDSAGTPLQVGQTYEMHSTVSPIPDIVKVDAVKPDSITVTMQGEYNSPSDPQDANGPGYTHEIDRNELDTVGLTFNPIGEEGEQEQSQDQAEQDGVGQTVNTEPVEQPHDSFPTHANFTRMAPMSEYDQYFGGESGAAAKAKAAMIKQYGEKKGEEVFYATVNKKKGAVEEVPTDKCPKCDYGHVTSNYTNPETVRYECYRCAHAWEVAEENEGSELNPESRNWLNESDDPGDFNFDRVIAMESAGKGRNIRDIAAKDPRHAEIHARLEANKTAGAKFSPREQKEFIDEDGVARNADRLNLDGTHYESAFDNSKARPDRVDDNYLGLGL